MLARPASERTYPGIGPGTATKDNISLTGSRSTRGGRCAANTTRGRFGGQFTKEAGVQGGGTVPLLYEKQARRHRQCTIVVQRQADSNGRRIRQTQTQSGIDNESARGRKRVSPLWIVAVVVVSV